MSVSERQCWALAAIALSGTAPVSAAERTLSITDFDRIQATGAMTVIVKRSNATSVRIVGDSHDLETIDASVHGQTLKIGVAHFGWGSNTVARAPLTVYVSTPHLSLVGFTGSGRIEIDELRGPKVNAWLSGSGSMIIGQADVENLSLAVAGSGQLTVGGRIAQAKLEAIGSATLDAAGLTSQDATLTAYGASTITARATRSADATATGAASIHVDGHPACSVHNTGAGAVTCD